jgi:plastocyanin
MKFNRDAIFVVLLLASSIFSIKFSLFDFNIVGDYYEPSQVRYVYADLSNDANSTIGSGAAGDPSKDNSGNQCDPADPACGGAPLPPSEICSDGVDNDGDGKIDEADGDCTGGPLPPALPGGGASTPPDINPSPIGDRNTGADQFSGGMLAVDNGPRTILGAAFQTNLLPIQAEAKLPREVICNDGRDNDNNGLKDSVDPGCGITEISQLEFKNLPVSISTKISENSSENHSPRKSLVPSVSPLTTQNNKTSVISILGGDKHDIRTLSSFHYGYSPEKITIEKGSKVMWINQDPTDTHGINLIDRLSGKTLFSNPIIAFENFAYYEFQETGQFTYVDPMLPSMTGEITVVK